MKKLIIAFLCMVAGAFSASAQWYAGGSVAGAYVKTNGAEIQAFNLSPETGYIFRNRLAVGGRISWGKSNAAISSPGLEYSNAETRAFTLNPYVGWGLVRFGCFAAWVEGGFHLIPEQKGVGKTTVTIYANPVLTYSLSHHFLLKTGLGFAGLLASTDFDGNYILAGAFGGDNALKIGDDLSIGFVYRF